jgi:hypothetical protein
LRIKTTTTHHITSLNEHGTKTAKFHMFSLPYLYLGEQPGAVADEGSGDGAQRAEHLLQLGPVGTVVRVLARSPYARTNNYCCKLDQFRFRCLSEELGYIYRFMLPDVLVIAA